MTKGRKNARPKRGRKIVGRGAEEAGGGQSTGGWRSGYSQFSPWVRRRKSRGLVTQKPYVWRSRGLSDWKKPSRRSSLGGNYKLVIVDFEDRPWLINSYPVTTFSQRSCAIPSSARSGSGRHSPGGSPSRSPTTGPSMASPSDLS